MAYKVLLATIQVRVAVVVVPLATHRGLGHRRQCWWQWRLCHTMLVLAMLLIAVVPHWNVALLFHCVKTGSPQVLLGGPGGQGTRVEVSPDTSRA